MTDPSNRILAELSALADRVGALEQRLDIPDPDRVSQETPGATAGVAVAAAEPPGAPVPGGGEFWALEGLRERLPADPTTEHGAVMLVGSVALPDGGGVAWQETGGSEGLLESEWGARAEVFAALGHPVRLELLRRVLAGTRTTAALAADEALGTTGQLHHHLRQLLAAGWLRQAGRGVYEVPAQRIVPLLACVLGAAR